MGKLRLFGPAKVVFRADAVMEHIIETYDLPSMDFRDPEDRSKVRSDMLREFSEACREDLHRFARR